MPTKFCRYPLNCRRNSGYCIGNGNIYPNDMRLCLGMFTGECQCCRVCIDELASQFERPLPGDIMRTRLNTGSTDGSTSQRRQLGLQLTGRMMAEVGSGGGGNGSGGDDTLGVFVAGVIPGSVADNDGNIRVGDELLQVVASFVPSLLSRDATQSAVLPRQVVRPSVRPSVRLYVTLMYRGHIGWNILLENNFTADYSLTFSLNAKQKIH